MKPGKTANIAQLVYRIDKSEGLGSTQVASEKGTSGSWVDDDDLDNVLDIANRFRMPDYGGVRCGVGLRMRGKAVIGIIALLTALLPLDFIQTDRIDLCEINHFYDENGKHIFDQSIFWRWNGTRHECQGWRLIKRPGQIPTRHGSEYRAFWIDGDCLRSVRFRYRRETWTQFDPELEDRAKLPKEERRGLTRLRDHSILVR